MSFFILCGFQTAAQNKYYYTESVDTLRINFENHYSLSGVSIIPGTERIILRDSLLKPGDYFFNYQSSTFSLSDSLPYSIFDTLIIHYQILKLSLQKEYKKRTLVIKFDESFGDTVRVSSIESSLSPESIFGHGMEKSGTIVRGFTVGTTRDFTLNSGLRLQLSGRLSDEIEVVAALTDENTPIQPEGNTERLEELDKVFIQVKHPLASGTFGDYQLSRRYGEFGLIDRKLQGLMGEFAFEKQSGYVSLAGSKGKFNSNNFNGIDGVQGPYRLTGLTGERDIIVIAGTEKVFIDGIEMRRGEANDYTIEYSNARITFTPKRLITSASRITVDFEYTDRRFARNFFGAGVESQFFKDAVGLKVQYLREGDDQDAAIDISLSDNDKEILSAAGDDRTKAVKSGVSLAPPDSLGQVKGIYEKIDTVLNGQPYEYYFYNPGASNAIYYVTFNFIGEKQGDYIKESLGNYRFAGINQGDYAPVIFLPMPELKQVGNVVLDLRPWEKVTLTLEYAGSLFDQNRFSNLDKEDDYGYARNIFLKMEPQDIKIGSLNFGKAGFSYKDRFVQDKFSTVDRFNTVEFQRDYNLAGQNQKNDETLREVSLNYRPFQELFLNSTLGLLKKGDDFNSTRSNSSLLFSNINDYSLAYNFDYVESSNLLINSYWTRQNGKGFYKYGVLKPGFEFLAEDKKDKRRTADSLLSGSLRYHDLTPFLEIVNFAGINAAARYSFREDFLPVNGVMLKESKSITQTYELAYKGIKEINSTLNLTLRDKKFTDHFKQLGRLDNETVLIYSQTRFNLWKPVQGDLFYEVSTQRSAKLERVFIRVERGAGNYIYLGDLNQNGIADENEFEPAIYDGEFIVVTIPTEELFPVIDLKTSTNWKIKFGEMFDEKSTAGKLLKPFSTETLWRIEENSREEDYKRIYLLNFSSFRNPATTIRGSNLLQQDFHLWENDHELSLRFRFSERTGLSQYAAGVENSYFRERSMRIRFKMVKEIGNQTDIVNQTDNVGAPSSNRTRNITSNNINTDFSYRPENNIEVGFKIKVGRSTDDFPALPTVIDVNSQTLRFNLSFAGSGRLRAEIERAELIASTTQNYLPFELTGGNQVGKNYFWRLNFDYRITNNLQSTISYDGRLQGGGRAIHTARAEARAYF